MRLLTTICFVLASFAAPGLGAETGIAVVPKEIQLLGPHDRHGVSVVQTSGKEIVGQVADVELKSSDENIVTIKGGRVVPVGNGEATITATAGGQTATAKVTVRGMDEMTPYSFQHDVQPVLAKMGCNTGACHGALAGKGGFRLSLTGYDPLRDHFTMTREARGRRVELGDPGRSLLLTKPTGAVAHKGGVRFETDEEPYKILSGWIAQGAKPPSADDAKVTHVEVLPPQSLLTKDEQLPLLVLARYNDGRVRDVTRWAIFTATDEAVATVGDDGRVTVVGPGEGAVVAWFASKVSLARVTSPYENDLPPETFASPSPQGRGGGEGSKDANFIDELVLAQLKKLNLPPSPRCSDEVFIRRAYLDTIGVLPTVDEVTAFLEDKSADKRAKLIDGLLARPEFVDYWAHKWSDVLLVDGKRLRPAAVKAYYLWIRQQVERNTPWDEVARQIVTAQGSSIDNGATNFYALHQTPEDMSENVSQAFLGLSIACAKCHNHPLEKWTNDQYYGMANLFARVRAKGWGGDPRNGDGKRTLYVAESGELIQPGRGKPQPPRPLDGEPLAFDNPADRREVLAEWLTADDNPYFARSIANRVWANFLGVGLVEQVDDLRLSNPASNEPLLAALADYTREQKYDLKQLMRVILLSETYQRTSRSLPGNRDETRYYARYYPRRLKAEVLLDAISQVTAVPSKFDAIANIDGSTSKTDLYPPGTRAVQLYDSAVVSGFLKTFGRNDRAITCECERSNEPTVTQVLLISNSDVINQKLANAKSVVTGQVTAEDTAAVIDQAYLAALSRRPTDAEKQSLLKELKATPADQRRAALEDLYWGVLSSREFLFQH